MKKFFFVVVALLTTQVNAQVVSGEDFYIHETCNIDFYWPHHEVGFAIYDSQVVAMFDATGEISVMTDLTGRMNLDDSELLSDADILAFMDTVLETLNLPAYDVLSEIDCL